MNKTTFYIEYLIVGTFALLAVGLAADPSYLVGEVSWKLLALVPLAYIAGLIVDAIGVVFEEILRSWTNDDPRWTKWIFREGNGRNSKDAGTRTVKIFAWNADVGEELKMRRSRDRVARGTMVTVLLLCVYLEIADRCLSLAGSSARFDVSRYWIWPLFAVLAFIWVILHWNTRDFKNAAHIEAEATAKDKLNNQNDQTAGVPTN